MRKFASAAVALAAAGALVLPAVGTATAAAPHAATGSVQLAKKASKLKVRVSLVRGYQHYLNTPDRVVVKVKGAKKGKITITVDGTVIKKGKFKKGKAKAVLPADLAVGAHTIKAKAKAGKRKGKGKKSITVYSGGVMPSGTEFTYSKSNAGYTNSTTFALNGTVTWKGQPATTGYVDIYKSPFAKGMDSPDYMCMDGIAAGGTFNFDGHCPGFNDLPVGDYTMQAFYTQDSDFIDYVTGAPILVHIVP